MKNQAFRLLIIDNVPGDWNNFGSQSFQTAIPFLYSVAGNLNEARNMLTSSSFQAVAADYILKDGLCTDLISELHQIPLVVMTSEGNEDTVLTALHSGAVDYLIKDKAGNFKKTLHITVSKSIEQKKQSIELERYRNQLENIVEERTIELIEMYSKLQKSETNFRNIFNSSNDGIIITGYNNEFIHSNEAMLRLVGVDREFLRNHLLMNYIMPDFRPFLIEMLEQVKKGYPSGIMEVEVISPKDGSLLNFEMSSVPIVFDNKNAILSMIRDIRERKNHARMIFETVIQTEEDERSRMARDLHDETGPLISALKIFTNTFLETSNPEKKDKLAQQIGNIVREVIDSIKIISNDMSPHVLVNFGLAAAVQNFIDVFSKNIHIQFVTNLNTIRFPKTVETLMYRIIKELINNTVKHAHAVTINIELMYNDHMLLCNFSDDGIGFNWNEKLDAPGKGMGLHNIITRIRSLGGTFYVDDAVKKGFHIRFELQTITRNDGK